MNTRPLFNTEKVICDLSYEEKLAWIKLIRTENIGPVTFFNFMDFYGSASKVLEVIPEIVKKRGGKKTLKVPDHALIEKEYEAVIKKDGYMIAACEEGYPIPLSAINDAPPVITVFGRKDLLKKNSVAIVGSRNASLNGCKFTEKLAAGLGKAGQVVVSGLARGIDRAAHKGSIESGTIAIVAGGADVIYPQENQDIYEDICDKGAVIAENPLGTAPRSKDFPRRNRIISGISQGTVVVEATKRSGSLITARMAAEQGRDVYAVPGFPYDPRAAGPNSLIRDGAALVRSADDIIESLNDFSAPNLMDSSNMGYDNDYPIEINEKINDIEVDEAHDVVIKNLSFTPLGLDELARACQLTISMLQFVLLELELAGRVKRVPGNKVVLLDND